VSVAGQPQDTSGEVQAAPSFWELAMSFGQSLAMGFVLGMLLIDMFHRVAVSGQQFGMIARGIVFSAALIAATPSRFVRRPKGNLASATLVCGLVMGTVLTWSIVFEPAIGDALLDVTVLVVCATYLYYLARRHRGVSDGR
jgi:hypothetical protein